MSVYIDAVSLGAGRRLTERAVDWAIAGGWAIDLFVGRATREHADVDVAVWRNDQRMVRAALAEAWTFEVADAGVLRPWLEDEWLAPPVHAIHARTNRPETHALELLLNERDATDWIYRRNPTVRRPLEAAILSRDGIPYLAPEIVLLYKSKAPRAADDADIRAALPPLSPEQRAWLHDAIARADAQHPWLRALDEHA